jgi:uncharacterized membrane protein (UPF0182 family)
MPSTTSRIRNDSIGRRISGNFRKLPVGRDLTPANPYYLTLDLIEPGKDDFLLFMPMAPFGRDNLRALIIAGSDGDNYGKIFAVPVSTGPAGVWSRPGPLPGQPGHVISEQFTLWDQEGSEVLLGKMIIEPTGGSLLYIQPVYLQEEGVLKIPQLKRLIMALDDAVVMAPSLEEAAVMLEAELARKSVRRDRNAQKRKSPDRSNRSPADDNATPPAPAEESSQPAPPGANASGEPLADSPRPGDTTPRP